MPDVVLLCDAKGRIVWVEDEQFSPPGVFLGDFLELDVTDMAELLDRFPPETDHDVPRSRRMHLSSLPPQLAPGGGFFVRIKPVELGVLRESPIHSLDCAVFRAVFHDAKEAILLVDETLHILAANRKAHEMYARAENTLDGRHCLQVLRVEDKSLEKRIFRLANEASWGGQLHTVTAKGRGALMKVKIRCLQVEGKRLYQFMLRDLRGIMALERDLEKSRETLAGMNIALRQVFLNVEEEKQELRGELIEQIKKELLPAVNRLAGEDSSSVRQAFISALEEKISDLVNTPVKNVSFVRRLTPREVDICRLIQQGWQGRAIAAELYISFETLQTHRKNIRRKLGLKGSPTLLSTFLGQQPPL